MADQVPPDVVRDRYDRLVSVVEEVAWAENRAQLGKIVDVLVAEGEGRKDDRTARMSGRAPDNRLVHFAAADTRSGDIAAPPPRPGDIAAPPARPGDVVTAEITYAAPHHLVADVVHGVRRTRAGDAWEARQARPASDDSGSRGVLLGMPTLPSSARLR
jgi:tRNA-2-methylthio-N6-dimethylallyladenosine synthase